MASQPPPMPTYPPKQGMSALKILGLIFLVLLLICGGCATWLFFNARALVSDALDRVATEMIAQTDLPQEQRERIQKDIGAIITAFKQKDISMAEVGDFLQKLADTNFMDLMAVELVESEYETKVKPDEARQEEVRLVFMRFKRGIVEEAIPESRRKEILDQVVSRSGQHFEIQEDLTAEELESVVEAMTQAVNEANIPEEEFQVDYAALVHDVMLEVFPKLVGEAQSAPGPQNDEAPTQE